MGKRVVKKLIAEPLTKKGVHTVKILILTRRFNNLLVDLKWIKTIKVSWNALAFPYFYAFEINHLNILKLNIGQAIVRFIQ